MEKTKVIEVIDGDTIKVSSWKMIGKHNYYGTLVKILGYSNFENYDSKIAKIKLEALLKGNEVNLRNGKKISKTENDTMVHCSVYLEGINIKEYFPELINVEEYKYAMGA